jgi:hypothetical protein
VCPEELLIVGIVNDGEQVGEKGAFPGELGMEGLL